LCRWRGLPGKDELLLIGAVKALGERISKKKNRPQAHIWRLPAHLVGPYAEHDAISTFNLFENLRPILDREGTVDAYRLEVDLLPMVLEMRLRGIRIDVAAAEQARDHLLQKRDAVFAELSDKLGVPVSMEEIARSAWLAATFDRLGIKYPRTEKGNPSFTGGALGWMTKHPHWAPQLIAKADKYNKAAVDFLQGHILRHVVNGRIHAEIHPHRGESNGTKSFRFSYSDPPLQQIPSRDEELAPLIRGVFLPEEGEFWAKPDASQQEFRLVVHYASQHRLYRADEAVARYRDDPDADFHALAATLTGLTRDAAKPVNFGKIYNMGVKTFAERVGKPLAEAKQIYEQYDRELPFLRRLSDIYQTEARSRGYITLLGGARRHFDKFAPGGKWEKGAGPCDREEAIARLKDPNHLWYRRGPLYRADTRNALNALIQGSAAHHTKLWMRECWREGIVPLLQMHDCLDCSVSTREQAELVARLGEEAVQLDVPMRVDLKYGRTWGDANHTWAGLYGEPEPAKGNGKSEARDALETILGEDIAGGGDEASHDEVDDQDGDAQEDANSVAGAEEHQAGNGHDVVAMCVECGKPLGPDRVYLHDGYAHPHCYQAFEARRLREEGVELRNGNGRIDPAPTPIANVGDVGTGAHPAGVMNDGLAAGTGGGPSQAQIDGLRAFQAQIVQRLAGGGSAMEEPDVPPQSGNSRGSGNGHDPSYQSDSHPPSANDARDDQDFDKPYGPIRTALEVKGYRVVYSFPFPVPGDKAPLFWEDRYELLPGLTSSKQRPHKTSRYHHCKNGQDLNGTGQRRIIYNWLAIMQASPGAVVYITEGANKAEPLNRVGLLATAAPYHQWGPECVGALAGRHLVYLEDHDFPNEKGDSSHGTYAPTKLSQLAIMSDSTSLTGKLECLTIL
jgi:DNA polymerase-1